MGFTSSQLAMASLAGQVGGGLISTAGSFFGASAQKSALGAQAEIAEINARIAELGAQSALLQGQQQVGAQTLRAGQLKSRQRAAMAANGVDLGTGSAAEVQASTDLMKEIDKNILEANAIRSTWGYRAQAVNFQNEALASRASAKSIKPGMTAFSTLLGSTGSVASLWYQIKQAELFDTKPKRSANYGWGDTYKQGRN